MSEFTFEVSGMTCEHCEHAVSSELSQLPGVQNVVADANTGRVSVTHDLPVDRSSWEAAVGEAGYKVGSWPVSHDA